MTFCLGMQFFTTEPVACDPSSLPKYPPSKEFDAKLRDEEARRFAFILYSQFSNINHLQRTVLLTSEMQHFFCPLVLCIFAFLISRRLKWTWPLIHSSLHTNVFCFIVFIWYFTHCHNLVSTFPFLLCYYWQWTYLKLKHLR